ncbi:MAG: hypothetical protein EBU46_20645, partial [Nitrosomonadaceae bacterium]|nr:hypothetical protein [Nitrosomonadaceae bacterium]
SPVTTPYIFDEPGVRQKLIQTWPSIRGTSQYEHLMELERRSPAEHTTAVSTGRSLLSQLQNNKLSAGQQSELLAQLRQLRAQYY